jgi:hypothetical protein
VLVVLALPLAAQLLDACSRSESGQGARDTASAAAPFAAVAACDRKAPRLEDLAGILMRPLRTMRSVPGDPQSCEYLTDAYPTITITLRPGLGTVTVDAWADGKMALAVTPLAAVGDRAYWQATLRQVVAERSGLLCAVQVRAGDKDLALPTEGLAAALGALCQRVVAQG